MTYSIPNEKALKARGLETREHQADWHRGKSCWCWAKPSRKRQTGNKNDNRRA